VPTKATYVGADACRQCHEAEFDAWSGSDHQRAMQVASPSTVLGDFDGAKFRHQAVESTFFKRDGRFFVHTDGPDGQLTDYEIKYTFGARPLQQYLSEFPGGRMQALGIAWDSRPREAGGGRWFHLYPDRTPKPGDPLHWTGVDQNWNHMCSECHSTNLRKNYRADTDRFETTWSEINVSCEACHGPGSAHLSWAKEGGGRRDGEDTVGLAVNFRDRRRGTWTMDEKTGIARRSGKPSLHVEVETCAFCHARRGLLEEGHVPGRPLLDTHRPSLLEEGLYYADGQIRDEVYEYGSFLQSRMYQAGVTCSDCHDPHGLQRLAEGNDLCGSCHMPAKFDTPAHHRHERGTEGARCVNCHMRARTYMVVDVRRDHSFRVPRPDLSTKLGTPDACGDCHKNRDSRWASDRLRDWYGRRERPLTFGEIFHAAQSHQPAAEVELLRLVDDAAAPAIVRATAVSLLRQAPVPVLAAAIERARSDADPLVREAAASSGDALDPPSRWPLLSPLLQDPVRGVRIQAARDLAATPRDRVDPTHSTALERGLEEFRRAQENNLDRAEAHLNLGALAAELGRGEEAERSYRQAIRIDPTFVPGYVNLADLYRAEGREAEAERVLRDGISAGPEEATLHHALGLALARQKRMPEALASLRRAAELRPDVPRYMYVFGVALNSAGQPRVALEVLRRGHERSPGDRDTLLALVTISRDRGSIGQATEYARRLVAVAPEDPAARELLTELEAGSR
jgi:Flp pilus assembly protein TadD